MSERAGYLTRSPSAQDGRASQLELTPAGAKLAADARHYQQEVFEQAMAGWREEERQQFTPLFVRFVGNVLEMLAVQVEEGEGENVTPRRREESIGNVEKRQRDPLRGDNGCRFVMPGASLSLSPLSVRR